MEENLRVYGTLYNWQKGKINPHAMGQLVEASIAFTKQYVPNTQNLTTQELFKSFLSEKKRLMRMVKRKIPDIPDSVLHHKMSLDYQSIFKLRKGVILNISILKRLDSLLTQFK